MTTIKKKTTTKQNKDALVASALTKIAILRAQLVLALPQREAEIDAVLDALVAGVHVLLLGPPGTAKTTLAEIIGDAIEDARFCKRQFHAQMPIDEIIGPIDVAAFQQGRYVRKFSHYASDAHVFCADEVFKAGGAILNPLLTLLESREVLQDGVWLPAPLITCVGLSNEIPKTTDGLGAFHDRFVIRVWVRYLEADSDFNTMCRRELPRVDAKITLAELEALQRRALSMPVSDDVCAKPNADGSFNGGDAGALRKIVLDVRNHAIDFSDRRAVKALDVMRARAARDGSSEVGAQHLDVLRSIAWNQKDEIPTVDKIVDDHAPAWDAFAKQISATINAQRSAWSAALKTNNQATIRDAFNTASTQLTAMVSRKGVNEATEDGDLIKLGKLGEKAKERAKALGVEISNLARDVHQKAAALGLLDMPIVDDSMFDDDSAAA